METFKQFCDLFHASHYIPISFYRGGTQTYLCSSYTGTSDIFCASAYKLLTQKQNPAVYAAAEIGLYGIVRLEGTEDAYLLGPVFGVGVTEETVLAFMRKNAIPLSAQNEITEFLTAPPRYTYNQFLNLLAFLHHQINGRVISVVDHFALNDTSVETQIAVQHTLTTVADKEEQVEHGTWLFETQMLELVRQGDTEKMHAFLMSALKLQKFNEGKLASNPLRQAKNLLIGLATMVGKAGAIGGGMDVEEAFRLIDLYIQECEKASSVEVVKALRYNLIMDFTERVAQSQVPKDMSPQIYKAVRFIQNRTNSHIELSDVAEHIDRSRAWLTDHFRREMGMTVGQFIMKSKLKEARSLLLHSDHSLAYISDYLLFSSQSHFQNAFKKEFGITPTQCRNQ